MKIEHLLLIITIIAITLILFLVYQTINTPYPNCEKFKEYEYIQIKCSNELRDYYGEKDFLVTECEVNTGDCDGTPSFDSKRLEGTNLNAVHIFNNQTEEYIFNFFSERVNEDYYLLWDGLMDEQEGWYDYFIKNENSKLIKKENDGKN